MCNIIEEFECKPKGIVEVAPWEAKFESPSDLADIASVLDISIDRMRDIKNRHVDSGRPVKAGYVHRKFGTIIVEYLTGLETDGHPLAVSMSAGGLGIAEEVQDKSGYANGRKVARWARDVFSSIVRYTEAIYGSIGVEITLPTPTKLRQGYTDMGSEIFVSRKLMETNSQLKSAFDSDFHEGEITKWPDGYFYSGWKFFNSKNLSIPESSNSFAQSKKALARAALKTR